MGAFFPAHHRPQAERADLVSLLPGQELISFWERLIMPPANILFSLFGA